MKLKRGFKVNGVLKRHRGDPSCGHKVACRKKSTTPSTRESLTKKSGAIRISMNSSGWWIRALSWKALTHPKWPPAAMVQRNQNSPFCWWWWWWLLCSIPHEGVLILLIAFYRLYLSTSAVSSYFPLGHRGYYRVYYEMMISSFSVFSLCLSESYARSSRRPIIRQIPWLSRASGHRAVIENVERPSKKSTLLPFYRLRLFNASSSRHRGDPDKKCANK